MSDSQGLLHRLSELTPDARIATLRSTIAHLQRQNCIRKYPTPGALAAALDPTVVQTSALELIDQAVVDTVKNGGRLVVTVPPQEGKSTRIAVWTPIWALINQPDTRVVVASYAESLARRNAMAARQIVREFGSGAVDAQTGLPSADRLGIGLREGERLATAWGVNCGRGSYYATGVGGALTGRSADLLIIDDPVKSQVEADSARDREKVWAWWTSVALTRLAPGAGVIIIMTRWHDDDLVGRLLAQDRDRAESDEPVWRVLNLPAIAEDGVPDALGRPFGAPLVSARGRSLDDWCQIRNAVGERTWSALYQGQPTPASGGLFSRDDFDQWRASTPQLSGVVVAIDPADSGVGDEAGLLVMGWDSEGTVWVTQDQSRRMTSASWARRAVELALDTGAGEVVYEAYTARETYRGVLEEAWATLKRHVSVLEAVGGDERRAAEALWAEGYQGDALGMVQRAKPYVERVRGLEDPPYRVVPWTMRGDKVARAAGARQGATTGRLRLGGRFPVLETQAATWQPGQGSPDRVDAMVIGYEHIRSVVGRGDAELATPGGLGVDSRPGASANWWSARMG